MCTLNSAALSRAYESATRGELPSLGDTGAGEALKVLKPIWGLPW